MRCLAAVDGDLRPLMQLDPSEMRNTTSGATSSAVPRRPIGISSTTISRPRLGRVVGHRCDDDTDVDFAPLDDAGVYDGPLIGELNGMRPSLTAAGTRDGHDLPVQNSPCALS